MKKCRIEYENAYRITAKFSDFNGTMENWKHAFYALWERQLAYSYAYNIKLSQNSKTGVFVSMLIKKSHVEHIIEIMRMLNFNNITVFCEKIGLVDDETADCMTYELIY